MATSQIPELLIRQQAVYFYFVPFLWLIHLLLLPAIFAYNRWMAAFFMVFPGIYLFTWLGYLMHECWHKYVPNVNSRLLYNLFAVMIVSDPQLYSIIHGQHHSQVHTWDDAEFHPLGEIGSRRLRVVYNWLEVVFGVAFLVIVASVTVPRDPRFAGKYRRWKLFASIPLWAILFGGMGYLSHLILGASLSQVAISYVAMLWLGSFFLHQSQLVEHGNLIIEGTFNQRNMRSRNLKPSGIIEKSFLFLTHNDSREHVLHHTHTRMYSRPFPGVIALPGGAVMITMGDYLQLLWRMLIGHVDREVAVE